MSAHKQKTAKWKFDKECTIYEVAQLHEKLQNLLNKAAVVTLDVSAIEVVDTSFIQLLTAAHTEALQKGGEMKLAGSSEALNDFAENIHCQIVLDSGAMGVNHDES